MWCNFLELWCETAEAYSSGLQFLDFWRIGLSWRYAGTQEHATSAHAWRKGTLRVFETDFEGTQSDGEFFLVARFEVLTEVLL